MNGMLRHVTVTLLLLISALQLDAQRGFRPAPRPIEPYRPPFRPVEPYRPIDPYRSTGIDPYRSLEPTGGNGTGVDAADLGELIKQKDAKTQLSVLNRLKTEPAYK